MSFTKYSKYLKNGDSKLNLVHVYYFESYTFGYIGMSIFRLPSILLLL